MPSTKCIYVNFYVGEKVYLYDPLLFNKYEIREEKIMKITAVNTGVTYATSNGYYIRSCDIGKSVFYSYKDAAAKLLEVLNENTNQT